MIKLIDAVLLESQVRQCPALETFLQKIRLSMWPVFQKQMHFQLESVRKLTNGTILKSAVKDSTLRTVSYETICHDAEIIYLHSSCCHATWLFSSPRCYFVQKMKAWSSPSGSRTFEVNFTITHTIDTDSLSRLREEVLRLTVHCTKQIKSPSERDEHLATSFGVIVNGLAVSKL
jgi:hypothetical protein